MSLGNHTASAGKIAVKDWLLSLGLHIGLLTAGVFALKWTPPFVTTPPVRWVSVELVSQNNTTGQTAQTNPKSVITDTPVNSEAKNNNIQSIQAEKSNPAASPVRAAEVINAKTNTKLANQSSVRQSTKQANSAKPNILADQATSVKKSSDIHKSVTTAKPIPTKPVISATPIATSSPNVTQPNADKPKVDDTPVKNDSSVTTISKTIQPLSQPTRQVASEPISSKTTGKNSQKTADIGSKGSVKAETKAEVNNVPKAEPKPKSDNAAQWKAQFIASVNRNKGYPSNARKAGDEGSVLLAVKVAANGAVECCQIKQSSGVSALDNAALAAANKALRQTQHQLSTSRSFRFDFYVDYILAE
jgi:TonB family protein